MAALQLVFMVSISLVFSAMGGSKPHTTKLSPLSKNDSYVYCDKDYSCVGCSTVRVCVPTPDGENLYEISRFNCGPTYPYCNYTSGSCSAHPDPVCASNTTVANFTCMRDGYFPDPYECSTYYHCVNEVPYQFSCISPNQYYHPGYQSCISESYYCAGYTSTYNCKYSSYIGRKVAISYTDDYFVYCGNKTVLAVDKCIGAYEFDSDAQICKFTCPHAGLFVNDNNCTHYYKCSPKSHEPDSGFILTEMVCPEGEAYSESEYQCVDEYLVPNCYKPYPDLYSK